MFTKESVNQAILDTRVLLWKNAFPNTPAWEQFIDHAHDKYWDESYDPYLKYDDKEYSVRGINIRENYYFMVRDAGTDYFPESEEVVKTLKSFTDSDPLYTVTFVNFIANEVPINIHSDPRHSFYWQTKGSSTWKVWHNMPDDVDLDGLAVNSDPDEVIFVEEGDLLFVPHGVLHSVDTPRPRTAMSFTYKVDLSTASCSCHTSEDLAKFNQ